MDVINKVWGKEIVIVNCDKYCCKILALDCGYVSSTHCHKVKQETFYCLSGELVLWVDGNNCNMCIGSEPVTIYPNQYHWFSSVSGAEVLEISTTHSDEDVYRIEHSRAVSKE